MIRCIAIDDEPLALTIIESHCSNIDSLNLLGTFTDPIKAIDFINKNDIDLLFIDIEMPKINGLDLLKTLNPLPPIIFTTAYSDYALESYDFNAVDYLLKPISLSRFLKAIQKIPAPSIPTLPKDYFFVKSENKTIKIMYKDILFIEGQRDYVQIHLHNSKPMALLTMKKLEQSLPKNQFLRTHKSFIVSLHAIESITGKTIYIQDNEIPIGESYLANVKKILGSSLL